MNQDFIAYTVDLIPNSIIHKTEENDISVPFITSMMWKTEGNIGMVLVNKTEGSFILLPCFSQLLLRLIQG